MSVARIRFTNLETVVFSDRKFGMRSTFALIVIIIIITMI